MKYTYSISATNLQAWAVTRIAMSPNEAANLDPEAFLIFAAEIEKVARKLRQPKQLRLVEEPVNGRVR
jgi:hypothetical protein